MGHFRVEVNAVGGHGCQRNITDGQQVQNFCGSTNCPDCTAREFVRSLKRTGVQINDATFTHWPGTETEVQDNLLTNQRKGSF